jgi:hypothetical protein
MSASDCSLRRTSRAASSKLGVISVVRGNNSRTSTATAASSINTAPLVATITGSNTTRSSLCRSIESATVCTISGACSMPILTASTPMSSTTASIWSRSMSGGTPWMLRTPQVFCAVSAVMAVMP